MKILVVEGSPHRNGNSARLVDALLEGAGERARAVTRLRPYDMKFKGCTACMACKSGKAEFCVHHDDFLAAVPSILAADLFVLATPVYFGQVTGPFKSFLDRWCAFFDAGFAIRHVSGKRYATVTTSGAPAEQFASVTGYLDAWFGGFFKMERAGGVVGGDLKGPGDAEARPDLLAAARELGAKL